MAACEQVTGTGSWEITSPLPTNTTEGDCGGREGVRWWILKTHSEWHTSSSKATRTAQIALPTRDLFSNTRAYGEQSPLKAPQVSYDRQNKEY